MSRTYEVDPARPVLPHYQDTATSCGPACVQMIVGSFSTGAAALVSQNAIRKRGAAVKTPSAHAPRQAWLTTPEAMATALNELCPPAWQNWAARYFSTETDLLAAITAAMRAHKTPAIVSQGLHDHWTVITGVYLDYNIVKVARWDPSRLKAYPRRALDHHHNDQCQRAIAAPGAEGKMIPLRPTPAVGGTWTWTFFDTFVEMADKSKKAVGVIYGNEDFRNELAVLERIPYEMGLVTGP